MLSKFKKPEEVGGADGGRQLADYSSKQKTQEASLGEPSGGRLFADPSKVKKDVERGEAGGRLLTDFTKEELRWELEKLGLSTVGLKRTLVDRLQKALVEKAVGVRTYLAVVVDADASVPTITIAKADDVAVGILTALNEERKADDEALKALQSYSEESGCSCGSCVTTIEFNGVEGKKVPCPVDAVSVSTPPVVPDVVPSEPAKKVDIEECTECLKWIIHLRLWWDDYTEYYPISQETPYNDCLQHFTRVYASEKYSAYDEEAKRLGAISVSDATECPAKLEKDIDEPNKFYVELMRLWKNLDRHLEETCLLGARRDLEQFWAQLDRHMRIVKEVRERQQKRKEIQKRIRAIQANN